LILLESLECVSVEICIRCDLALGITSSDPVSHLLVGEWLVEPRTVECWNRVT
jgi:hypothetical protein